VRLTPGDWFLTAVNVSGGTAAYSIKATEFPVYGTNIVITNSYVFSNTFCLTWTSVPDIHYYVEGKSNLLSASWDTISPTITAVAYSTTYCVPLPSPYQFFRVHEGIVVFPAPPPAVSPAINGITRATNGVLLQWAGPTNGQFKVQWKPSLSAPVWNTFSNVVTSPTGHFLFLDDGSQSGGLGTARFYRFQKLP